MKTLKLAPPAILIGTLVFGGCAGPDLPVLTPNTIIDITGDKPFEYKAPTDGFIHVYDVNQDKALFNGSIKKDQVLSIDPQEKNLSIGGKMAPDAMVIPGGDTVQIQFRAVPAPQ